MPFVADRAFGWKPVEITDSWGLKTIKNGMAYSLCNTVICRNCDHLFLDIRFSESEMNSLYKGYREHDYTELREKYEPGYRERNLKLNSGINYIDAIEDFLSLHLEFPVSILDWGGDTGKNTPYKTRNKLFHIFDISNKPELITGAKKIAIQDAIDTDYDLIVCSNVPEHVPYPADLISSIKALMHADSVLYIEVPLEDIVRSCDSDTKLVKKKHWHEHINFFSESSMRALLSNRGLEVIDFKVLQANAGSNTSWQQLFACKLS
jgi:SAM-dependent methyltransferase